MKKNLLFAIVILLLPIYSFSQNLVQNCSFEDTIHCPPTVGHLYDCKDWFVAGDSLGSPDYYKACGQYPSVPQNQFGFQYAATGNSYIGLIPFYKNPILQKGKEFVGSKLITSLSIGQRYYVSFKVNLAISLQSGYASNKTGVLFSTVEYSNSKPVPINNFAHVYTDSIITDTVNWVKISGWFVADSVYQYINIGNFFDEAHTDTLRIYNGPYNDDISYYYIDDVCVSIDSTKCSCDSIIDNIKEKSNNSSLYFYYNNVEEKIIINNPYNEKTEIQIYDLLGKNIYKSFLKEEENEVYVGNLSKGIYILNFNTNNKSTNSKIIIN